MLYVQDTWWPLLQWVVPLQVCAGRLLIPKVDGAAVLVGRTMVLVSLEETLVLVSVTLS